MNASCKLLVRLIEEAVSSSLPGRHSSASICGNPFVRHRSTAFMFPMDDYKRKEIVIGILKQTGVTIAASIEIGLIL